MGAREVKGEKLKFARGIAERHLAEFRKGSDEKDESRFCILAARHIEKASGLPYADCLKFVTQGRW